MMTRAIQNASNNNYENNKNVLKRFKKFVLILSVWAFLLTVNHRSLHRTNIRHILYPHNGQPLFTNESDP